MLAIKATLEVQKEVICLCVHCTQFSHSFSINQQLVSLSILMGSVTIVLFKDLSACGKFSGLSFESPSKNKKLNVFSLSECKVHLSVAV